MFANGILLAAAQEVPPITPGVIAAALLVIGALACSVVMAVYWLIRRVSEMPMLPSAARRPMHVPVPAVGLGIVLMLAFAVMNIAAGILEAKMKPEAPVAADAAEEDAAEEEKLSPEELATLHTTTRFGLWVNLAFTGFEFLLFGAIVYVSQDAFSRALRQRPAVAGANAVPAGDFLPDDSSGPTLDITLGSGDPYRPPDTQEPNPFLVPEAPPVAQPMSGPAIPAEPWSFPAELLYAFQAFLVAYMPTVVLRGFLVYLIDDEASHPLLKMLQQDPPLDILAMIFFTAVIVAPIVEELVFRVVIMGGLLKVSPTWVAVVVSSVLFGLAHGFPDSIALLPLAFVLAYTYHQRRSYRTVILIHMIFNGFNMLLAACGMFG